MNRMVSALLALALSAGPAAGAELTNSAYIRTEAPRPGTPESAWGMKVQTAEVSYHRLRCRLNGTPAAESYLLTVRRLRTAYTAEETEGGSELDLELRVWGPQGELSRVVSTKTVEGYDLRIWPPHPGLALIDDRLYDLGLQQVTARCDGEPLELKGANRPQSWAICYKDIASGLAEGESPPEGRDAVARVTLLTLEDGQVPRTATYVLRTTDDSWQPDCEESTPRLRPVAAGNLNLDSADARDMPLRGAKILLLYCGGKSDPVLDLSDGKLSVDAPSTLRLTPLAP